MRNSLDELPVLACMLWGGLIAGLVCSLLRLPGKVYAKALRGRRAKPLPLAAIAVCDIAVLLNMTKSAVSHQLRQLRASDLVKTRRDGKVIFYSLADDHVKKIIEMAVEHLEEREQ